MTLSNKIGGYALLIWLDLILCDYERSSNYHKFQTTYLSGIQLNQSYMGMM